MDIDEFLLTASDSSQQYSACLWDYNTLNVQKYYKNGGSIAPKCLEILGEDYVIASESGKPCLNVWQLNGQEVKNNIRWILPEVATCLTISPTNIYLAVGMSCKICVWHVISGKLMFVQQKYYQPITCVKFSSDGKSLLSGGQDGLLIVYNMNDIVSISNNFLIQSEIGQVEPIYIKNDHCMPIKDIHVGSAKMVRLSIVEYMRYLGGTESSRCVHEGEEVVNAGHVITLGTINSSDRKNVKLCALCLQTSALNSAPHHINGMLHIEGRGNVKVMNMNCSCKAGNSGKCKHVSAVLIKCTRENIDELEVMSQTDLKCVWSTQKNVTQEKYKAVSIDKMPCVKMKILEPELNVDEQAMAEFFMRKLSDAATTKHRVGRRDLESSPSNIIDSNEKELLTSILNHACQSIIMMELASIETANRNDCCNILYNRLFNRDFSEKSIFQFQHSNEWKAQRKYRVTGSRVYELFTYSKQEWECKSLQYFFPKSFTNKYVKHGLKYESDARDAFIKKTGFIVIECGMVISHFNEWLGFSPDGIIMTDMKPAALLEIKCLYEGATSTIMEAMSKATYLRKLNGKYYLKEKHKYHGQIQLGMAFLLNLNKCYLALFASFDNTMHIIEVNYAYNFTKKMMSRVKINFFESMLHNLCKSESLMEIR